VLGGSALDRNIPGLDIMFRLFRSLEFSPFEVNSKKQEVFDSLRYLEAGERNWQSMIRQLSGE
jgi:hypothetical protein